MPCERVDYYSDEEFESALIQEEQAWDEHQQEQQEPDIVPCFECGNQMYHESHEPKENICEECKTKKGNTVDTKQELIYEKPTVNELEVTIPKPQALATVSSNDSPMVAMATMMANGHDIDADKMEKLFAIQKDYEANEARKAYHVAMAAFKADPPKIVKDMTVSYKQTRYNHASLANVAGLINSALGEQGLSASWVTGQKEGMVHVTCKITHVLGHSESTDLFAAPDATGSKNAIQSIGSTVTYLQRYTILALTGLATGEHDNDGASQPPTPTAPVVVPQPNEAEAEVIKLICHALPHVAGMTPSPGKVGMLCYCADQVNPHYYQDARSADAVCAWLLKEFQDTQIYDEVK